MTNSKPAWRPVVEAADCPECACCGELECPSCGDHYADCDCPGPHQCDQFEYRTVAGGWLEARALQ